MNNLMGRRFLFGCLAILCVSMVSAYLKYTAEIYVTLVTSITSLFMVSQSVTDMKEPK